MERTACCNLRDVRVGEWVIVCDRRSGRETPRQVVDVDAKRGSFSTAAHTYTVISATVAEDIKNSDLVAVAVPEGMFIETWMPYARN